jgi:dephospho-CoA kinase
VRLIAFAGLSGAGKTTAIDLLVKAGVGERMYVGDLVRKAVAEQGLPINADTEREVRIKLRNEGGPAVLAERACREISAILPHKNVLLDAVYSPDELAKYKSAFSDQLYLVSIEATARIRAERLILRPARAMTSEQLAKRDDYELRTLRLDTVMAASDVTVENIGNLVEFELTLNMALADVI